MSAPKRFFIPSVSEETILTGEEYRHAKNVLRLREGDEVTLFDGSGAEYSGIVARTEKGSMTVHVVGRSVSDKDPRADVCLLVGALKGDKTELVVQKATELGVSRVVVFSSRYCAAYCNENKLLRLNKVAHEAAKQCLRATVPEVAYSGSLAEALASAAGYRNKLFACEFAEKSGADLASIEGSCALVVGSEGGFSEEEFALAQDMGYAPVTLGKRILRAETAAIALLSVVMFALGELG